MSRWQDEVGDGMPYMARVCWLQLTPSGIKEAQRVRHLGARVLGAADFDAE
ncbi:MAG: hypothetical protein U0556_05110 [Dehalococcoidia bacterium]